MVVELDQCSERTSLERSPALVSVPEWLVVPNCILRFRFVATATIWPTSRELSRSARLARRHGPPSQRHRLRCSRWPDSRLGVDDRTVLHWDHARCGDRLPANTSVTPPWPSGHRHLPQLPCRTFAAVAEARCRRGTRSRIVSPARQPATRSRPRYALRRTGTACEFEAHRRGHGCARQRKSLAACRCSVSCPGRVEPCCTPRAPARSRTSCAKLRAIATRECTP